MERNDNATAKRSHLSRRGFVIAVLATALAVPTVCVQASGLTMFGYVAHGDVATPGGKIQTWRVWGGLIASDRNAAERGAQADATARLARKGNILVGPTIVLCSPFVGLGEALESER